MPEAPRTWTLESKSASSEVITFGPALRPGEVVEVIEKAPVDAERERILDLLERWVNDGVDAISDTEALLRERGRLEGS